MTLKGVVSLMYTFGVPGSQMISGLLEVQSYNGDLVLDSNDSPAIEACAKGWHSQHVYKFGDLSMPTAPNVMVHV